MDTVVVKKDALLEAVRENREGHRELYIKALEGYRLEAAEWCRNALEMLKDGEVVQFRFGHFKPEDHTKDYDRVIRMLEMSVDDEIELSQQDFAMYVMDDWGWKDNWMTSNSAYLTNS